MFRPVRLFACPRPITRCLRAGRVVLAAALGGGMASADLLDPEAGRPIIRDYRPAEYGGHPQIFDVAQDDRGFIYLVSYQGIKQYDGIRWQHLDAPLLFSYRVAAARDGRIWTTSVDTIGYFESVPGSIEMRYQSLKDRLPPTGRYPDVKRVGDDVYLRTDQELIRWRGDAIVRRWPLVDQTDGHYLTQVGDELYWLWFRNRLLKLEGDEMVTVVVDAELLSGRRTEVVSRDGQPPLWVIGERGVFELEETAGAFRRVPGALDDVIKTTRINMLANLGDGTIAVATSLRGLVIIGGQQVEERLRKLEIGDHRDGEFRRDHRTERRRRRVVVARHVGMTEPGRVQCFDSALGEGLLVLAQ